MKYFLSFILTISLLFSCGKKDVQQKIAEDIVIQIMTSGQWSVTNYTKGGIDLTADFSAYKFQFKSNRTVDALNNNALEKSGTWNANATERTITSTFTGASQTLNLLNGTWKITNTTLTSVDATLDVNGETRILKLNK